MSTPKQFKVFFFSFLYLKFSHLYLMLLRTPDFFYKYFHASLNKNLHISTYRCIYMKVQIIGLKIKEVIYTWISWENRYWLAYYSVNSLRICNFLPLKKFLIEKTENFISSLLSSSLS